MVEQQAVDPKQALLDKKWVTNFFKDLDAYQHRFKDWHRESQYLRKLYDGGVKGTNFNILYPNTDLLAASLISSSPRADVRALFDDDDPVTDAVSQVLRRALQVQLELPQTDDAFREFKFELALYGRSVMRVRYALRQDEAGVQGQFTYPESVHFRDFAHTASAKTWSEVEWVAFRQWMTRDQVTEEFGPEWVEKLSFSAPTENEDEKLPLSADQSKEGRDSEVAAIWEVWDKRTEVVRYCNEGVKDAWIGDGEPLGLEGFFPCPSPSFYGKTSHTLNPQAPYHVYRRLAEKLERSISRYNQVIEAMKVRGVYDQRVAEMSTLFNAADNTFLPIESGAIAAEAGGFEKLLWLMPIERFPTVLASLADAIERQKQWIYEISGLSDLMRASTNANEALGTQKMKAQYGSQRMRTLQNECADRLSDVVNLMGQVISERFEPQILTQMTALPVGEPTMLVLRSDVMRLYKLRVEEGSTVDEQQETDFQALNQLLLALSSWYTGMVPLIQTGIMPPEMVNSIAKTMIRKNRMGIDVEDAINRATKQMQAAAEQQMQQQQQQMEQQAAVEQQQLAQGQQQIDQGQQQMDQQAAAEQQKLAQGQQQMDQQGIVDFVRMQGEQQAQQKEQLASEQSALQQLQGQSQQVMQQAEQHVAAMEQALTQARAELEASQQAQQQMRDELAEMEAKIAQLMQDAQEHILQTTQRAADQLLEVGARLGKPKKKRARVIYGEDGRPAGLESEELE